METASTEVTSIWRRNDIEKSTWRTHRYFVDFESRIHVEISTSNRCHNFHVDSPFKIDLISTNFPRGISTSNRWRIDEDVSIGLICKYLPECIPVHHRSRYFKTGGGGGQRLKVWFSITRRSHHGWGEGAKKILKIELLNWLKMAKSVYLFISNLFSLGLIT